MNRKELVESYREVLRSRFEEPQETRDTDRARGVPGPPAETPYPEDAVLIDLTPPEQLAFGRMPVAQAMKQRRSRRQYAEEPLSRDELAFLLWATQGVQKSFRQGFTLRTAPAGGA